MPQIALYSCPSYDSPKLESIIQICLSLKKFSRGDNVVVKANMVNAHAPEKCVTSHPAVVEQVCHGLLDLGCKVTIADSPGIEPFERVARVSGIAAVGEKLGVPVRELGRSTACPPLQNKVHSRLELSADILEADSIVSLPKLKTHSQMQLTMAVKNLFGCVVGLRKSQWHYAVGLNRLRFADLLLDIAQSVPPVLSIVDGVMGMEGHGPTNGTPRSFGLVAASVDPVALDAALAAMMGLPGDEYLLIRQAKARNIGDWGLRDVQWLGDFSPDTRFERVDIPSRGTLSLAPSFMDGLMQRFLASRPEQNTANCVACGCCTEICPAKAVKLENKKLIFDYSACIRCYCCQEMCPADAIALREGVLMRFLRAAGIARD